MGITIFLGSTAIFTIFFFTEYSQNAYQNNSFGIKHTHEVLDTTSNISEYLLKIQNNNLQNILLKNIYIFQLNTPIKINLLSSIEKLKQLTSDNLLQQSRIDSLNKIVKKVFEVYVATIDSSNENFNIINLAREENTALQNANYLINLIQEEEERLLIIRQKKRENYINKLNYSFCFLIGGIFILIVIIYFIWQNTQEKTDDFKFKEQDYLTELQAQEQLQIDTDKAFSVELAQYNYVMSHDLKEPLRMIIGFMDLLQKDYSKVIDEKGNTYINYAVDGAKRMQNMINEMLKYASIGVNKRKPEKISLLALIEEVKLNLFNQIEESNTKIIIETPLCYLKVYKAEMLRLLQNVISNAIKFKKINITTIININCDEYRSYWQISIKDNGIGIKKIYHEKIFDIFTRLHIDKEYDGTGIGLAISKKIAEQHKGKIWVESEPDLGCIFHFTISKDL